MMDRMGNLYLNKDKYAKEATGLKNFKIGITGILFAILLLSNIASAESVTYYLNATSGVNIGADGVTNVTGSNQIIPQPPQNIPIRALLDKTGLNSRGALTNDHPHVIHNHSRWYFTTDYSFNTKINANPAGKVLIYASSGPYPNLSVLLFDYNSSNGSKTLIGSSSSMILSGGATNTAYSYTIYSPTYIVPMNHRLMLQLDFDPKTHGNTNERVYANKSNSYLNITETPITYNVTINSTLSSANIAAGTNFTYIITVNNTGTTDGNYSLSVSDSGLLYFRPSVLGNTSRFIPGGGSNQTTLTVTAYEEAPKDAINTATVNVTSIENPIFTNITQTITTVTIPITYNVTINLTPSSANVTAGGNYTYNITVNNTGTTNGNYSLSVSDSDTTNFSSSVLAMTTLFILAGGSNDTTITVNASGSAQKDADDMTTITVTSIENSLYTNITQITTTVSAPSFSNCVECHESYVDSVDGSKHNQTKNTAAPTCISCHKGYLPVSNHTSGNKGYIVNESNTCRTCHIQGQDGFDFDVMKNSAGTQNAICTQCHFANTTTPFDLNASLLVHDHNLTIEHSFNYYNKSGTIQMPLRKNDGVGDGMFPYWACSQSCHGGSGVSILSSFDNASLTWVNSKHAQSLVEPGSDNNVYCAKCKSPLNYNVSIPDPKNVTIAEDDWQGIQCRICHNIMNISYSNSTGGKPLAFYNATASSLAGYSVYDSVHNATELCEKCHTGSSHDSKYAGTHKDTVGFDCASCHLNTTSASKGGFNNRSHSFEVKNAYTGVTGCEVCHDPSNHTFQYTSNHTGNVSCIACHDQTFTTVNATGYAVSNDGNYGLWQETPTSKWTTAKKITSAPATWPLHNLSKSVNCLKCHNGAKSVLTGSLVAPMLSDIELCGGCHATYSNAVLSTKHNTNLNPSAPNCTSCHTGYLPVLGHTSGNRGYIVTNETCNTCHVNGMNGFDFGIMKTATCTQCHFANTTAQFDRNSSLLVHDHNLTIEHSYNYYNQSGTIQMPLRRNNGTGLGMFPYWACSQACHGGTSVNPLSSFDNASLTWVNSKHAQSLVEPGSDNNVYCARCKSPLNYNVSIPDPKNVTIAPEDWQGIQCRICHNIMNISYSNSTGGKPLAFYNATASSLAGYSVYDSVHNATELCEKCHTGSSHDSKYAGTHKDTVGFDCASCHLNTTRVADGGFNNKSHSFEVKNAYTGVTGCEVCHNPINHTVLLCKGKIDCVGCHDQTVQRNLTGFAVSSDNNYGLYKDNATDKWTTYKVSKGSAVSWPLHNLTRKVVCEKCHGTVSVYSGLITQATGSFCERCHYQPPNGTSRYNTDGSHSLHKEKGFGIEPETSCDYCHSTGGKNELGHPSIFDNADVVTNGSVTIGMYLKKTATGSDDTCGNVTCHSYNLSQGARVGNSTWNTSTADLCNQCHSTQISGSPPTGNHTKHNEKNVTCSTCHGNNSDAGKQVGHRDGQIEINLTKLASSGNYVSGTCSVYCHSPNPNDLVNITPTWNITKIVCVSCHSIPPAIFKTRNGNNHPQDPLCDDCHGAGASTGTNINHINGAVDTFELKQCLSCHEVNGSASAKIDTASFGMHRDVNNTDGGLTNADCLVCHYNITGMFADYKPKPGINVYECMDCHLNQTINSTKVSKHIPGSNRSNLSVTTMKCEDCHVNSVNIPENVTAINSTMEKALHYGTRTNLVNPTAGTYNTACDNCHNSSLNKTKFGAQNKQIYIPHTATGKCNMCHIPAGEADTLHNSSISIPLTVSCIECHTKYASKYKAPNLTGTSMAGYSTCNNNNNCHMIDQFVGTMDTLARHNIDMTKAGTGGYTDTVYLDNKVIQTVIKGSSVIVTSRVNDTALAGGASRVGGAEYYIDNDPGQGKGIYMEAVDGFFSSTSANWEYVIASLNTSNLLIGEHKIFVRGVDIGKQWSAPKNATLVVQSLQSLGYINGTVKNGTGVLIPDAYVSTTGANFTTGPDGKYSLIVTADTYTVNASKQPEFYDYTETGVIVEPSNTTTVDIVMDQKPTGTISGVVRNV
jgi:predicted CxxxxCH...CXXCH cytochrome family protein